MLIGWRMRPLQGSLSLHKYRSTSRYCSAPLLTSHAARGFRSPSSCTAPEHHSSSPLGGAFTPCSRPATSSVGQQPRFGLRTVLRSRSPDSSAGSLMFPITAKRRRSFLRWHPCSRNRSLSSRDQQLSGNNVTTISQNQPTMMLGAY
jgi:hypothetical protein